MSSDRERECVAEEANERSKLVLEEEGRVGDTLFHVDTYPPPPPPPPFSANLQLGKAPSTSSFRRIVTIPSRLLLPLRFWAYHPANAHAAISEEKERQSPQSSPKVTFPPVITLSHRLGESPVCVRMRSHFPFSLFLQMVVVLRTTTYYAHVSGVSREMRASLRSTM